MTQYINNFKNNVIHGLQQTAEVGSALGKQIVTFDRSGQVFGETPEAQLKGRDRIITKEIVAVALGVLLLAFSIHGCVMHPGATNYFMTGFAGFATLVALKEIAVQSIARSSEKKKFEIEKETKDTKYSFQELMDEFTQDMNRSINQLFGRSATNNSDNNVELTEMPKKEDN